MHAPLRRCGSMVALTFALLGGCGRSTGDSARPTPTINYDGPPVRFTVETGADWTQFGWQVSAPTGGWEVKFVGAITDERHAVIRVRLTRPGADEMVTQALETLSGDYRHGARAFESAELHVSTQTRGEETVDNFKVAATWP